MSRASRPNIVVYISHDTGRFIGPYGVRTVHTPSADRVAAEGVLFENCFCAAPQCSPSRAALFTGRYPHANGVMGLTHGDFAWDLPRSEVHAAQWFKNLGYDTMGTGSLHEIRTRAGRGFDAVLNVPLARQVGSEFDAWLAGRSDPSRPFYVQIATIETHRGFLRDGVEPDDSLGVTVQPPLRDTPAVREDFSALQGSVRRWDEGLGAILKVLDQRGYAEDTILVVTADHGIPMPRAKVSLYDPGIGVMLLIRWPNGPIAAGMRFDEMVSNVDILPTLLEAVGTEPAPAMQGRSFWPLMAGGLYQERDRVYAEMTFHAYYDPMRCVRTRQYKYIRYFEMGKAVHMTSDNANSSSSVDNRDHLGLGGHHAHEELYDLQADPYELENLVGNGAFEPVRRELSQALADWMRDTGDPLLRGPIASPFYRKAIAELGM
jgi:arylsulfatase A-like enzyme